MEPFVRPARSNSQGSIFAGTFPFITALSFAHVLPSRGPLPALSPGAAGAMTLERSDDLLEE